MRTGEWLRCVPLVVQFSSGWKMEKKLQWLFVCPGPTHWRFLWKFTYVTHFSSPVARRGKKNFLSYLVRREWVTVIRWHFWVSLRSWGNHVPGFFVNLTCFKWCSTAIWLTDNASARHGQFADYSRSRAAAASIHRNLLVDLTLAHLRRFCPQIKSDETITDIHS